MATTVVYPGLTGAQSDFAIPFEYLSVAHVHVTVGGLPVPFTFSSKYLIHVTNPPVGTLKIARITPNSNTINDYPDGSILAGNDLDNSFYQNLFINEELQDVVSVVRTDLTTAEGAIDAIEADLVGVHEEINEITGDASGLTTRISSLETVVDGKAPVVHTHDASSTVSGQFPNERIASLDAIKLTGFIDPARLPVISGTVQVVSSGDLTALTVEQKDTISRGAVVTSIDGKRWLYTGAGDKALEASYILVADITPEWNVIAGKPSTFPATTESVEGVLSGRPDKDPLIDTDAFALVDTADSNKTKLFRWANVKARLKAFFDTLYYTKGASLVVDTAGATIIESKGSTAFLRLRSTLGGILDFGLNSDSSFSLTRYNPAGAPVDSPIAVAVDGTVTLSDLPYVGSTPLVPAIRTIGAGVSLTTAVVSGSYRLDANHPDLPTTFVGTTITLGAYSILDVSRGQDTITQTLYPFPGSRHDAPYWRTGYGIGTGTPIWSSWRRMIIQDNVRQGADADMNTRAPGFFFVDNGADPIVGAPATYSLAWSGLQTGNQSRGMQLATGYGNNDLWFRGGQDGWMPWRRTWDNVNLPVTTYGAGLVNAPDAASARSYLGVTGGSGIAGVSTFNSRAGNVVPQAGDYAAHLISYDGSTQHDWNGQFRQKLQFITPELYGAVGDGVADDAPAFQAMINAASARGAIVLLAAKKYRWNSVVTISGKTMKWVGSGGFGTLRGTSIEFYGTGASHALSLIDAGGSVLEDFSIIRLGGSSTGTLLDIDGTSGWNLIRLMGLNLDAQGSGRAAHFKRGFYLRANHCRFVFGGISGRETVLLNGVSDASRMDNCEFIQCHFAGDQNGSSNVVDSVGIDGFANSMKFIQCGILFGKHGIRIRDSYGSSGGTAFLYISNGGFENAQGTCLLIDGPAEKIMINGAYISNDGDESLIRSTSNMLSGTFASDGGGEIHISGSHIRGAGLHGIDATHGTWTITGNRIVNMNRNGSATGYGVIVRSTVTDCQIVGNKIGRTRNRVSPTAAAGVRNDLGAACVISSNDLRGNTTAISGTTAGPGIGLNVT